MGCWRLAVLSSDNGEQERPLTPTLSPGRARGEGAKSARFNLASMCPLSPGSAGGEGWGEGGLQILTPKEGTKPPLRYN
ncbi:hypothetical protein DYGSA30_13090 [Dyella sp. GSA-30]|nr:hypothetical protein DYGSA30_13090 [Dyella sp. GSA-30]